jgi:hypothetical protein
MILLGEHFKLTQHFTNPIEQATAKVAQTAGVSEEHAKTLSGQAKGKAEELKGEAKGKAEELKGQAKGKAKEHGVI